MILVSSFLLNRLSLSSNASCMLRDFMSFREKCEQDWVNIKHSRMNKTFALQNILPVYLIEPSQIPVLDKSR